MKASNTNTAEITGVEAMAALEALDAATPQPAAVPTTKPRTAKQVMTAPRPVEEAVVTPLALGDESSAVPFTAADYAWMNPEAAHGAAKLAASAVSPLVASARGYFTVSPDAAKEGAARLGIKSMNSTAGRQVKDAAETGDAMAMPWFAAASVGESATLGKTVEMTTYQLRPSVPVINGKGKLAKYVLPAGSASVLDVHPATPASWFTDAPTVVLAEGLLKADSALTAMLMDAGVTREEMAAARGGEPAAAREALRTLMEGVPAEKRVLIIGLVGSGNWHQNPDFNAISFRGRSAWVALDADVATNDQVWKQADALISFLESPSKKAAEVHLVKVPAVAGDPKAGLDDYFGAGGSWSAVQAMLGATPARPEMETIGRASRVARVNFDEGATVAVVKKETEAGATEVKQVIAEAAVVIEKVETVREAQNGLMEESTISGRVSWLEERGGSLDFKQQAFSGIKLSALISRSATPTTFLATATGGRAAGAYVSDSHGADVLAAWRASVGQSMKATRVRGSGVWEHEGRYGYLTSQGLHTAEGIDPTVRADVEHLPNFEMPFVQFDEGGNVADPGQAAKIVAAADQIIATGEIFHKSQGGFWEASIGHNLSISALDIQAKTTMLVFGPRGFGKTTAGIAGSGWNGSAWLNDAAIKLKGNKAQLESQGEQGNNVVFFVDDARSTDESDPYDSDFKIVRKVVDSFIRMGNEPETPLRGSMVLNASGAYTVRLPRRGAVRSALVSGEDLDALNLSPSTVQRGISWTITHSAPLFRGRGEAEPAVDALRETGAQALIKSMIIQENLRNSATGMTPEERREAYRYWGRHHAEIGKSVLRRDYPEMTERDLGGLGPILGGIGAFVAAATKAVVAAGGTREDMKRFSEYRAHAFAAVGEAWKRHRATYAEAQERTWQPVIERLVELFALDAEDGQAQPHLNGPLRGSVGATGIGDDGDIALFPGAVADLLGKHGYYGMTSRKLGSILKEIIKNRKHSVRISKNRAPISAWLIDGEKWRLVTGETATEADAGLPTTDPLPDLETADWDRELVLLTSAPATTPAPVRTRQKPVRKLTDPAPVMVELWPEDD